MEFVKRFSELPKNVQREIISKLNKENQSRVASSSKETRSIFFGDMFERLKREGLVPRIYDAYLGFVRDIVANLMPGERFVINLRTKTDPRSIEDHLFIHDKDRDLFLLYTRDILKGKFYSKMRSNSINEFTGRLKEKLHLFQGTHRRIYPARDAIYDDPPYVKHAILDTNKKMTFERSKQIGKLFLKSLIDPISRAIGSDPDEKLSGKPIPERESRHVIRDFETRNINLHLTLMYRPMDMDFDGYRRGEFYFYRACFAGSGTKCPLHSIHPGNFEDYYDRFKQLVNKNL